MKVSELIEKLGKLPQDNEVVIPAADDGANPVKIVKETVLRKEHYEGHWAYGQYVNHGTTRLHNVVLLGHSKIDTDL